MRTGTLKRRLAIIVIGYLLFAAGGITVHWPAAHRWIAPSFWLFDGVPLEAYRYSIIKSIQTGTINLNGAQASNTATITAVTAANAYVGFLGRDFGFTGADANGNEFDCNLTLTNTTTVTAARNAATGDGINVGFVVVEYAAGGLKSNQDVAIAIAAAATTNTATITSVVTTKSMIVYRGNQFSGSGSAAASSWSGYLVLTNATTITANRSASLTILTVYGTVVEFK